MHEIKQAKMQHTIAITAFSLFLLYCWAALLIKVIIVITIAAKVTEPTLYLKGP